MQKKDLKLGEIYAYSSARRRELQPVLFLSADLHTEKTVHFKDGTRDLRIVPSHPRATMQSSYGSADGYLVLWVERDYYGRVKSPAPEEQFAEVQKYVGQADEIMASISDRTRTGGRFMVGEMLHIGIVNSRDIQGPWEDVYAARKAADAKSAEFDAKGDAWAEARNARLRRSRKALEAFTGETVRVQEAVYLHSEAHSGQDGSYRTSGSVTLTLDQVEQIIAAVAARPLAE